MNTNIDECTISKADRSLPSNYMPSTHRDFGALWNMACGGSHYTLSAPDKPDLVVQHRGTPTMCGGTHLFLRGLRGIRSPISPGQQCLVSKASGNMADFFSYQRRGIMIIQATLSADEAAAWLPVIEESIRLLGVYYTNKEEVLAYPSASWTQQPILPPVFTHTKPQHIGNGKDRTHTYLWMLQHANVEQHDKHLYESVLRCPLCKEMVRGAICRPCGHWLTGGHQAYTDDNGLGIDKSSAYGKNHRYEDHISPAILTTPLFSAHINPAQNTPLVFLTSWFRVSQNLLPSGRAHGTIIEVLKGFLKKRYIPIITSNVGFTGNCCTPHVLAALYQNQELLARHGMRLCTADTFGTNPKEHYHWIDSAAVVPTSWAAVRQPV